jgi:hypothetical protein
MKAVSMWRWSWSTFRTMVVSLLMLAPLLVYAVPSHAVPAPHEHATVATLEQAVVEQAVACPDHEETLCDDAGLLHDVVCCVAQCAAMHSGLPPDVIEVFVPCLDTSAHLPAPAMPEGISSDPALRPPSLIV